MIRRVELQDAKAIAAIYNEYVIHSVVTFDIEPVREEDMRGRMDSRDFGSLSLFCL